MRWSFTKRLWTQCLTNCLWEFYHIATKIQMGTKTNWLKLIEVKSQGHHETVYSQNSLVQKCTLPAKTYRAALNHSAMHDQKCTIQLFICCSKTSKNGHDRSELADFLAPLQSPVCGILSWQPLITSGAFTFGRIDAQTRPESGDIISHVSHLNHTFFLMHRWLS